ncbi:MAG TPA: CehA/McbA family metallohydrolase [Thermoplasmata archaeon]|nr:CehA/McbA family metallohydrolase [Thermoplasmata archaeon]
MGAVRLDLHVHSHHSPDSSLSIEAIATSLAGRGLNGFALTDHNSVAGHGELAEWQAKLPQYLLVPGVEVSTIEGHLLAYGVLEAPPPRRPISETIEWVVSHGGVPVLSHPFRLSHGVGRAIAERVGVSAIETINAHNSPRANGRAADLAARRRLGTTGGSDVHELPDLGRAFTEFPEGTSTVGAVLAALRSGAVKAGGETLPFSGRARTEWRTVLLRLRRGLRPI